MGCEKISPYLTYEIWRITVNCWFFGLTTKKNSFHGCSALKLQKFAINKHNLTATDQTWCHFWGLTRTLSKTNFNHQLCFWYMYRGWMYKKFLNSARHVKLCNYFLLSSFYHPHPPTHASLSLSASLSLTLSLSLSLFFSLLALYRSLALLSLIPSLLS